jgi:hypothetical protein
MNINILKLVGVLSLLTFTYTYGASAMPLDKDTEILANLKTILKKEEKLSGKDIRSLTRVLPSLADSAVASLSSAMSEARLGEICSLLDWGLYMGGIYEEDPNYPLLRLYVLDSRGELEATYTLADSYLKKGDIEKAGFWYVKTARKEKDGDERARLTLSRFKIYTKDFESKTDEELIAIFITNYMESKKVAPDSSAIARCVKKVLQRAKDMPPE